MSEPCSKSRRLKAALGAGTVLFLAAGLTVGALWEVFFGTAIFAVGVILLAIRGYLGSGDRAVTGVLIFVALAAVAVQAVEFFLVP